MTAPVERIARAAAARLSAEYGPALPVDVEAALHASDATWEPERYLDPTALGALIVSVANLAWTIYTDLKHKTPNPSSEVLTRAVRVQLHDADTPDNPAQDRIVDVVITETLNHH
jgi:hypothetical protein